MSLKKENQIEYKNELEKSKHIECIILIEFITMKVLLIVGGKTFFVLGSFGLSTFDPSTTPSFDIHS